MIERFFEDMCVFGPRAEVTRADLFDTWESWAIDEGEIPGKQTGFSRVMKERSVVKNFVEAKVRGTRIWRGIGLKNDDDVPPTDKVPPTKDLQTWGVVKRGAD